MTESVSPQTFGFEAEVKQLLHLVVHSLYSNAEVFLRELISNASDANDKLRFEALATPALLESDRALAIEVAIDAPQGRLTVTDNGIGMSREEIIANLGTIAHSGTARYLERLTGDQKKDSQLIGQFGVGFYSAFVVADEVEVQSRKAGEPPAAGVRWRSDGKGEYSVESIERSARGTAVTLQLKTTAHEFLDEHRIRALIRKYSDHIAFPVTLKIGAADAEVMNDGKALWVRPRTEINDAEYVEFYKHVAHDSADPLTWSHNRVEGRREYTSLLYIPAHAPLDLWNRESPRGVKLYVQRVFITDDAAEFLPLYLRFVRGVLDTGELALNVSREMLQQDPAIATLRGALTKRVLDMLDRLVAEDAEKYATFWREFGAVLKEGLAEDPANRNRVAQLLRFNTTRSAGAAQDRSLAQYVADARPGQEHIYYLLAETAVAARSSPQLEAFLAAGVEVLLLADRLDPWAIQHLEEFSGKTLKDVARGELDLPPDVAQVTVEPDKDAQALLKKLRRSLRERVSDVRSSARLKESAACVVLGEHDVTHQMRELLRAAGHDLPATQPILEVNLAHPLLRRLTDERDEARFARLCELVLDEALLADGRQLEDPAGFVRRLNAILADAGALAAQPTSAPPGTD